MLLLIMDGCLPRKDKYRGYDIIKMSGIRHIMMPHLVQKEQLNEERARFEKERTTQNLEIHAEKQEMAREHAQIDKAKSDLRSQRDELQRQKDALQRQMDLFEQQKSTFHREVAEEKRRLDEQRLAQTEILVAAGKVGSRDDSEDKSKAELYGHRRTGSNDLFFHQNTSREGSPFESGASNNKQQKMRSISTGNHVTKSQLPLHLVSATNEVRTGQVPQKLPLKLAGLSDANTKQVLPFKLSSSSQSTSSLAASNQRAPQSKQVLTHTLSHPTIGNTAMGVKRNTQSPGNLLPMKLAEKSAKSSVKSDTRQKSNKGDSDRPSSGREPEQIIYF